MEIKIKGKCPNCNKKIMFHHDFEKEDKGIGDPTFNLLKKITRKVNLRLFFENSRDVIKDYFDEYKEKIIKTNDPRELLRLTKEIQKKKIRISKDSKNKFNQQKNNLLDLIRLKIKGEKKKRK